MDSSNYISLLFILFVSLPSLVCTDETDDTVYIYKLRTALLASYQRLARPVKNHKTITQVSYSVFLRKIVDLDVKKAVLTTFANLYLEWKDEHMVWNANDYGGINEMVFSAWEVWTPDIRSWAAASGINWWRSVAREPVRVNSSGIVSWWTRAVITSYCDVDLSNFPFDKQYCSMGFVSWTYDISELNITDHSKYPKQIYGPFIKNPEWSVVGLVVHKNDKNESVIGYWPKIMAELTLQRRTNFYMYNTGLPYLAAGLLVICSFLSPIGSTKRYYLVISAMLIYSCLLIQLGIRLGPHSIKIPYAVKCVAYSMTLVAASVTVNVLTTSIIEKCARKRTLTMPRALISILELPWLGTLCCLSVPDSSPSHHPSATHHPHPHASSQKVNDSSSDISPDSPVRITSETCMSHEWFLLQQLVDRICFVLFILATLVYHS